MLSTLFGLLILIADILAIVRIAQSKASTLEKIIWILIIIIFPIIGLIIWYFVGPGVKKL